MDTKQETTSDNVQELQGKRKSDASESPGYVREPFLTKKKGFFDKFRKQGKTEVAKELKEPLLLLMKENGYTEIIEGAKPGRFTLDTPGGLKEIFLSPDKQTTLKYGEDYYKTWVAHENEFFPYPVSPVDSAETFKKVLQKIAMNYREANDQSYKARGKMWLYILGGIALVLMVIFSFGGDSLSFLFGSGAAEQAASTAVEAVKANITAGAGGPVTVS